MVRGLWPPSILRYLFGRAKAANLDAGGSGRPLRTVYPIRVGRCLRGAYWLTVLAAVHLGQAWSDLRVVPGRPATHRISLAHAAREIAHHSNAPDDGDLTNSRVFRAHPFWSACVFPYGQAFHLTHHLFDMIPHHRMAKAHALLPSRALSRAGRRLPRILLPTPRHARSIRPRPARGGPIRPPDSSSSPPPIRVAGPPNLRPNPPRLKVGRWHGVREIAVFRE